VSGARTRDGKPLRPVRRAGTDEAEPVSRVGQEGRQWPIFKRNLFFHFTFQLKQYQNLILINFKAFSRFDAETKVV
jgi:hypothetical protein